ncbi:porin [Defluviimonas sp. WL0002]|uniref:Porin n=1 Tax=Albidovulum marisflavi TaxID=2984159 RepID=A0ABT2ZA97_9RHOB|nr:porin [Defluviimonas sp. WL0002]MCV2868070.1 porin [Defluviimonas sp. WL0002]
MKIVTSVTAALIAALPGVALAQDISGAFTLGYADSDISDVNADLNTTTIDGRVEVGFANGLTFGARYDRVDTSIDGVPFDITGDAIGLDLGYGFGNGFGVGAYWEDAEIGIDDTPLSISARSYGVSASYETHGLEVGGFYGRKSTDPDLGLDFKDYGLTMGYEANDQLSIGGNIMRTRISAGGESVDLDMVGLAGSYSINDQWTAFGGVSRTSVDLADLDITTFGLGVSYDLSAMSSFGGIASLELARTNLDLGGSDGSIDSVRIGFTIPFGAKANKVPLNSVADSVMNPTHAVLSSTVLSAF